MHRPRQFFSSATEESSWIVNEPMPGWCLSYTAPQKKAHTVSAKSVGGNSVSCYSSAQGRVIKVYVSATTIFVDAEAQEWLKRNAAIQKRQALAEKFSSLVEAWNVQRGAMSSITAASMCPAYQAIIGMGKPAVPLILSQLQTEGDDPDQWFWALSSITGADPVSPEDRGNFPKMARSWLEWGRREGYAR